MSFKNPSWSENSLYSYASSSLCPPLPLSLIWIFWMYSQNFVTGDLPSLGVIFSLCLWLLAHTYSSWKFLKSALKWVWKVWPEMSSTAFLSFVNSEMTWSLFLPLWLLCCHQVLLCWSELSPERHFVASLTLWNFAWGLRISMNNSGLK